MGINDFMAQKIKEYKEKHGLNQHGMAKLLDVSRTTIQRYEKGISIPLEVCERVARLWGTTFVKMILEMTEETESERKKREFLEELWEISTRFFHSEQQRSKQTRETDKENSNK